MPRFRADRQARDVPAAGASPAPFLPALFPKMEIVECSVFRVTRDADFEVSDEADDLLEAVELELRKRRFGHVVRVEVISSISSRMLELLKQGLGVAGEQIYMVPGLLGLADLDQLVEVERPELKDELWIPVTHSRFAETAAGDDLYAEDPAGHRPAIPLVASSFEGFVESAAKIGMSSRSRRPSTAPTRIRRSSPR